MHWQHPTISAESAFWWKPRWHAGVFPALVIIIKVMPGHRQLLPSAKVKGKSRFEKTKSRAADRQACTPLIKSICNNSALFSWFYYTKFIKLYPLKKIPPDFFETEWFSKVLIFLSWLSLLRTASLLLLVSFEETRWLVSFLRCSCLFVLPVSFFPSLNSNSNYCWTSRWTFRVWSHCCHTPYNSYEFF